MKITLALVMMGWIGLLTDTAFATCSANEAIFSDEFEDNTGGWQADNHLAVGNGAATLTVEKGQIAHFQLNVTFLVRDADICVNATFPSGSDFGSVGAKFGGVGLLFWATDYQNFYQFFVSPAGQYSLYRRLKGQWLKILAPTDSPAIKKGPGETNQLEVALKAGTAIMFVNGTRLAMQRAMAPQNDLRFGFCGQADQIVTDDTGQAFTFKNFVVNTLK